MAHEWHRNNKHNHTTSHINNQLKEVLYNQQWDFEYYRPKIYQRFESQSLR